MLIIASVATKGGILKDAITPPLITPVPAPTVTPMTAASHRGSPASASA